MIVVDTSAVVEALVGQNSALRRRLSEGGQLNAPHLIDVEFLHVMRKLVLSEELSTVRAADARGDYSDLAIVRYPHTPLADRAWRLQDNLTAYDAVFVVLAEALDAPLVTTDGRLSRAPGHDAQVEVYAP